MEIEITEQKIRDILEQVNDPEIPVLNIIDLGIVRDISVTDNVCITITPTYSGCPAMQVIEEDIVVKLKENGIENFTIKTALSPAWTTDWMTPVAKKKLLDFGIAPPGNRDLLVEGDLQSRPEKCPHCGSPDIVIISAFGSTPCKQLYVCKECREPFDYFKCH